MTPKESKAYRAALVRIIRNAGCLPANVGIESLAALICDEQTVLEIGKEAPSIVAAHLTRLIEQRARTWTRGNGSGNDATTQTCNQRCDALQATVDSILALFGIEANWDVGLYPVYTVNGHEEHQLLRAIRESFQGKVTR